MQFFVYFTKELIPGFTVIEVESKDAAIKWVTRYRELIEMPGRRLAEIQR